MSFFLFIRSFFYDNFRSVKIKSSFAAFAFAVKDWMMEIRLATSLFAFDCLLRAASLWILNWDCDRASRFES